MEGNIPLKSLVIFSIYGITKKKKEKKSLLAIISRNILTNKLFDSVLYQRWLNYFSLNFLSFYLNFLSCVSRFFIFIKILIADINFCCWLFTDEWNLNFPSLHNARMQIYFHVCKYTSFVSFNHCFTTSNIRYRRIWL